MGHTCDVILGDSVTVCEIHTRLASWSNSRFSLAGAHFGVIFHNDYFCVHDVLFNSSPRRREGFYRAQASESKFFLFLILFLYGWFFFFKLRSFILYFCCLHVYTMEHSEPNAPCRGLTVTFLYLRLSARPHHVCAVLHTTVWDDQVEHSFKFPSLQTELAILVSGDCKPCPLALAIGADCLASSLGDKGSAASGVSRTGAVCSTAEARHTESEIRPSHRMGDKTITLKGR